MNKSKAIFVTALIAFMLVIVDAGLYILYLPGFFALTGAFAAYGFLRSAGDFCRWLSRGDGTRCMKPIDVQKRAHNRELFDWQKDKAPVDETDSAYFDALIEDTHGHTAHV